MSVTWTKEQQKVIDLRNRNILVSAAAGSGKTAVLVERIIAMLTRDREPVDVDRLLIVTFTEAAAAEMKESGMRLRKNWRNIHRMNILSNRQHSSTMHRSLQFTASVCQ